jgi:hypothetical protein
VSLRPAWALNLLGDPVSKKKKKKSLIGINVFIFLLEMFLVFRRKV